MAGLPPSRFAVGSAVVQTARQVGGAIGVAVLVAILGSSAASAARGNPPIGAFQALWGFCAATSVAALGLSALLSPRPTGSPRREESHGHR